MNSLLFLQARSDAGETLRQAITGIVQRQLRNQSLQLPPEVLTTSLRSVGELLQGLAAVFNDGLLPGKTLWDFVQHSAKSMQQGGVRAPEQVSVVLQYQSCPSVFGRRLQESDWRGRMWILLSLNTMSLMYALLSLEETKQFYYQASAFLMARGTQQAFLYAVMKELTKNTFRLVPDDIRCFDSFACLADEGGSTTYRDPIGEENPSPVRSGAVSARVPHTAWEAESPGITDTKGQRKVSKKKRIVDMPTESEKDGIPVWTTPQPAVLDSGTQPVKEPEVPLESVEHKSTAPRGASPVQQVEPTEQAPSRAVTPVETALEEQRAAYQAKLSELEVLMQNLAGIYSVFTQFRFAAGTLETVVPQLLAVFAPPVAPTEGCEVQPAATHVPEDAGVQVPPDGAADQGEAPAVEVPAADPEPPVPEPSALPDQSDELAQLRKENLALRAELGLLHARLDWAAERCICGRAEATAAVAAGEAAEATAEDGADHTESPALQPLSAPTAEATGGLEPLSPYYLQLATAMKDALDVDNRAPFLMDELVLPSAFSGFEAVNWLVSSDQAQSRAVALALCRKIYAQGLIRTLWKPPPSDDFPDDEGDGFNGNETIYCFDIPEQPKPSLRLSPTARGRRLSNETLGARSEYGDDDLQSVTDGGSEFGGTETVGEAEADTAPDGSPIFHGWLERRVVENEGGSVTSRLSLRWGRKEYRKRYFVLQGQSLMYFQHKNEFRTGSTKPRSVISLHKAVVVRRPEPRNFLLEDLETGQRLELVAASQQEREMWVNRLSARST